MLVRCTKKFVCINTVKTASTSIEVCFGTASRQQPAPPNASRPIIWGLTVLWGTVGRGQTKTSGSTPCRRRSFLLRPVAGFRIAISSLVLFAMPSPLRRKPNEESKSVRMIFC